MLVWIAVGAVSLGALVALARIFGGAGSKTPARVPAAVSPAASTALTRNATTSAASPAPAAPASRSNASGEILTPQAGLAAVPAAALRSTPPPARRSAADDDDDDAPEDTVMAPRASLRSAVGANPATKHVSLPDGFIEDPTMPFSLILVTAIGRTDAGRRRATNEDSYLALEGEHLYVVADGMGGHAAGEVASNLVVETIANAFQTRTFGGTPDAKLPHRGDELVRAIETANRAIYEQARANRDQSGMGTTLVAARFSPNKGALYIAHVGDSRCYRVRDGQITQLTRDHTLGEALGIKGRHADQLTRAVGTEPEVAVELTGDSPKPDDHYILCSDGLPKMVSDENIRAIVEYERDLERACAALIEVANESGGTDNITVIIIRVEALATSGGKGR